MLLKYITLAVLVMNVSLSHSETLTLGSGLVVSGRIGELEDNILKFYADKYYAYPLSDIRDIKPDKGIDRAEKEKQLANITRLNKVINRAKYLSRDIKVLTNSMLLNKKYSQLDTMAATLIKENQRFLSGRAKISVFYDGFDMDIPKGDTAKYRQRLLLVDDWVKATGSNTAKIASIHLHSGYAWAYRGTGFSNTVNDIGREKFSEILRNSATKAEAIKMVYTEDLTLFTALINIYKATDSDNTRINKLAIEGARLDPTFYGLYYQTIGALLPKWGGSIDEVKTYVQRVATKYDINDKQGLYFRLVKRVFTKVKVKQFPRYRFSWDWVLRSFQAYEKEHELTEYDYHLMARMAGVFGDAKSFNHYLSLTTNQWNHFAQKAWKKKTILEQFTQWANNPADKDFSEILVRFLSQYDVLEFDKLIRVYVFAGGDINRKDVYGDTLLHKAVNEGRTELISLLIDVGADVNAVNGNGQSGLYIASRFNRLAIVKKLVESGGDPKFVTVKKESTAAHTAAFRGFTDVVRLLIDSEPNLLNQSNNRGFTPLHMAASKGHVQTVNLLLSYAGIELDTQSDTGSAALHFAAKNDHLDIVKQLVSAGANINLTNNNGHTPLSWAQEQKIEPIASYLKIKGANDSVNVVSSKDRKKSSALYKQSTAFFNANDYPKAQALIAEALEYNPNNALAYHGLAVLNLYHSKDYGEAERNISQSLTLNPNDAESYYTAGRVYYELNQPEKYKPLFQKYVVLAPDSFNTSDLKKNYPHLLTTNNTDGATNVVSFISKYKYLILALCFLLVLWLLIRARRRVSM